jgi:hypothetical protein
MAKTTEQATEEIMKVLLDFHPNLTFTATIERAIYRIIRSTGAETEPKVAGDNTPREPEARIEDLNAAAKRMRKIVWPRNTPS